MDLPLLLSIADELDNLSSRMYSDDFGLVHPHPRRQHHYHQPSLALSIPQRYLLQRQRPRNEGGGVVSHVGKDGFQVSLDVQQFKPSELTVKTVGSSVVVEGNHEEREDEYGFISRRFVRRYELPKDYDPNHVTSTLSSDGILTIRVPAPLKDEGTANERVVHIQQTGPAHLSVKDNAPNEPEKNGTAE